MFRFVPNFRHDPGYFSIGGKMIAHPTFGLAIGIEHLYEFANKSVSFSTEIVERIIFVVSYAGPKSQSVRCAHISGTQSYYFFGPSVRQGRRDFSKKEQVITLLFAFLFSITRHLDITSEIYPVCFPDYQLRILHMLKKRGVFARSEERR